MNKFKIAHLREQGSDMVIVLLDSAFENKPSADQQDVIAALQACSENAGLAGIVVPVWQYRGRLRFIAPHNWLPFFESLNWNRIVASVNKELSCG